MAKFRPNLGQFWPKWVIFEFSPKSETGMFFRLQRLGVVQKIRKFQCAVFKKNVKTTIFGHFGQIWVNFGQNGPKRGHFRIFGEKVKTLPSYPFFLFFKKKIREIQYAVFEKWGKPSILGIFDHFGSKWPILDRRGPKWPIFEFSWKKTKTSIFYTP